MEELRPLLDALQDVSAATVETPNGKVVLGPQAVDSLRRVIDPYILPDPIADDYRHMVHIGADVWWRALDARIEAFNNDQDPVMQGIIATLRLHDWTDPTIATWLIAENVSLGGMSPDTWLQYGGDAARVELLAHHQAWENDQ
ncbi:hypothetical protein [Demequina sp. NBRC 110054]|uniref:hypothetical protein n=1 Tax=Demequina sp. NBRC 110054 TaxID=1570343 RepID=UPI000A061646|nr:hypothetical protein [Demequina sp. NBRC 110054]